MKTIATSKGSTNRTCIRKFSYPRLTTIACLLIMSMQTINSYGQSPCIPPQSAFNVIGLYISNVNTAGGLTNFTNTTGAETASYGNYSSAKIAS
jgi:hypothetical protein